MYTIYALIDPRDGAVRYVGITTDVYRRFREHIRSDFYHDEKGNWIRELKASNAMLRMDTLEQVSDLDIALRRENYWIQHYLDRGADLLNHTLPMNEGKSAISGAGRHLGTKRVAAMLRRVSKGGKWPEGVTYRMQRYYKRKYPEYFEKQEKSG